jgi:cytoskeletal protein RodZ
MVEQTLRQWLAAGLEQSGLDVDTLAERTKVPRSTIRSLLGERVSAILPERVYLRGQAVLIARELGVDADAVRTSFDREHPVEPVHTGDIEEPRLGRGTTVVAASLGCVAILAIVLAFVG